MNVIKSAKFKTTGLDEKNSYALQELEKNILNKKIPNKCISDSKKTMSRLLGWEIDIYLENQKYKLALKTILDSRMKYLPQKRNKLIIKLFLKYMRVI